MWGICFLLPDLLGVICFALLPFAQVVIRSFQGAVNHKWVGFDNYKAVFQNAAFRMAAGNTLRFTAICIPLLVALSLVLAVTLQHLRLGKDLLKSAFLRRRVKTEKTEGYSNDNSMHFFE